MRKIIYFYICILLLGCNKKDEFLTPSDVTFSRFEFPQGTSKYDTILNTIFENHNVRVIYNSFTVKDWIKTWTPPAYDIPLSNYSGWVYTDTDSLTSLITYLDDVFFKQINNHTLSDKIFPPYIYLVKEYKLNTRVDFVRNGFDFWLLSPNSDVFMEPKNSIKAREFVKKLVFAYILTGVLNNSISEPVGFISDMDFSTPIVNSPVTDVNYYLARGFIPYYLGTTQIANSFETFNPNFNQGLSLPEIKKIGIMQQKNRLFLNYVTLALRYTDTEIENLYKLSNYKKAKTKYDLVIDHCKKNYGIDLKSFTK